MSKRSPKSVEEKLQCVQSYLNHEYSISQLIHKYQVSDFTIKSWVTKYQTEGIEGLTESRTWKKYSQSLKRQAVEAYLNQKGSMKDICARFKISHHSVLERWIKRYTSGKELKATSKGLSRMKQGRKTTFEERVEIVNYTIAHDKNYQEAVEKFGVSYQQVYSWVRKFEKDGSNGLLDRRGKGLESKPNLTPEEETQLEMNRLKERIQYLEMENKLLKKLEEIERRNHPFD